MHDQQSYDVVIIGGGLAGLSSAIQFSRKGYSVLLVEKEKYPFHKVCGEYISRESWPYLSSIGLDPAEAGLPLIDQFLLTAPNGNSFQTSLDPGGFGISRYKLDLTLYSIAVAQGVQVLLESKVDAVSYDQGFSVKINSNPQIITVFAKLCIGSFGKKSNLDVKWKRSFLDQQDKRLQNFIGVKYHIKTQWPSNLIGLHNFKNGYCGISKIEDDKYCLCYLTKADNLKFSGNNISQMEAAILFKNPHLEKIFKESEFLEGFPITISQVIFKKKTRVENHVLMAGDAGGMITPLCGNGMSIALHTGKMAAEQGHLFLSGKISRDSMEKQFEKEWKNHFEGRLRNGRILQRFFGSPALSNGFVGFFNIFPFMAGPVIKQTHGKSF